MGDQDIKQLKKISNAGSFHRSLISLGSIDSDKTKEILGIDLKAYNRILLTKIFDIIPNIGSIGYYFKANLSYCPICLNEGHHSILHQLNIFTYCAFHPEQKLLDRCLKCNTKMPEYLINKGSREAFRCECGHNFLGSTDIKSIYLFWGTQPEIKNKIINLWLQTSKEKTHQYHIILPFKNYEKYFEIENTDLDYLSFMPKLFINAFHNTFTDEVIKISSNKNIFNIKNNYKQLKEVYMEVFSDLFYFDSSFTEKDKMDSIHFDIYKQTRSIYKSITRYILRKLIKEHSTCVKIFNKSRANGDICPFAYAFVLWKMECEDIDQMWKFEYQRSESINLGFTFLKEHFSVFPHGSFMTHIVEVLNMKIKDKKINFANYNMSSINYIVNRIISHLLIERFIKWLEVVKNPEKFKRSYPDDNIPMYIVTIPHKMDEEISFYLSSKRIEYMTNLIKDIGKQMKCPIHKSKQYPRYQSPSQIVMNKMWGSN